MTETRFNKIILAINGALPLAFLGWDAWHKQLGANPVNFAIRTTGMMSLIFLPLSLAVTPLRKLTGWNWLINYRRILGLYAFFYAAIHLAIFFTFDRQGSVSSTLEEIIKRQYIWFGTLALLCMTPLAITSTDGMIKRLGAKRWQALHRLAYVAAIAGVIHYYMLVKADTTQPIIFAIVVALLIGYRIIAFIAKPAKAQAASQGSLSRKSKYWTGQLRVARITEETHNVKTFRVVSTDGSDLPFNFRAGQYLNLTLTIAGKRVNRSYTIASSPTHRDYCEITVKREENGTSSRHLHDDVHEADILNIGAPAGEFTFDDSESTGVVLIAGGVGITPLMSILRDLTDRNWPGQIHFIFSGKTPRDIIFHNELQDLQRRFSNLHVTITLSRADHGDWAGERGRITRDLLTRVVPDISTKPTYVCGPADMMSPVQQMLRDLGVPENRICSEAFDHGQPISEPKQTSAEVREANDIASAGPHEIVFTQSHKSTISDGNTCLLEVAESIGVDIDYACRSGVCGHCKTRLISGQVQMDTEDALTPDDIKNHIILCCQAKPLTRVELDA